jgi:hypothetical protein
MSTPVIYVYILVPWINGERQNPLVFTWPNVVKKYIRDAYTGDDGELHLPPAGRLYLTRNKVNPKLGQRAVTDLLDIEAFLAA